MTVVGQDPSGARSERDREIEIAIPVRVSERQVCRVVGELVLLCRLQRAVTGVEEHREAVPGERDEIRSPIAIEVPGNRRPP